MSDYLLSLKLLVERLKLNHESKPVPIRTADNCLESRNGNSSPICLYRQDDEPADKIVYRRKRYPECASSAYHVTDHTTNGISDRVPRDVFRYPSVHVNCCESCGTTLSSNSRVETTCDCSDVKELDEGSERPATLTSPYIRLSLATYDNKASDVCGALTVSPSALPGLSPNKNNQSDNISGNDNSTMCSPRYSPLTPTLSGSCLEIPSEHGHNSPLFLESNRLSQVSSLGVSSNRSSRSSSVSSNKPRLSFSKSVPLSPQPVTKETRERQLCGVQLKLDTLKAELMTLRKTKQELASQLLLLYSEIQIQKVKRSCMNHCELLDEAIYEAEIADELPTMLDAPHRSQSKLLTHHGVTSFNIARRRFSCS